MDESYFVFQSLFCFAYLNFHFIVIFSDHVEVPRREAGLVGYHPLKCRGIGLVPFVVNDDFLAFNFLYIVRIFCR